MHTEKQFRCVFSLYIYKMARLTRQKCIARTIILNFPYSYRPKHFSLQYIFRYLCWDCARNHLQFFMWSARYFCYTLRKIDMCGQILLKLLNIKFHKDAQRFANCYVRTYGRTDGRTDKQTDRHQANPHAVLATFNYERSGGAQIPSLCTSF
jgi:hypothetical protein